MGNASALSGYLNEMGIRHNRSKVEKLVEYQSLLEDKNRQMNLIGPADTSTITSRHILDSLAPLLLDGSSCWNRPGIALLDIGSGGGLPGIPLGIMLDKAGIVLLEKTKKKADFLSGAVARMSLDNIKVLNGRAEDIAREEKWRESFDVVVARAVTGFKILLELSIPFCRINGKIIFYKSRKVFSEIEAGSIAIDSLGGKTGDLIETDIPGLEGFRALLVIDKIRKTPQEYPRKFSKIKKKPLH